MLNAKAIERVKSRTETKLAMIEELAKRSQTTANARRKTAFLLLQCLHDFARRQFDFFMNGFSSATEVVDEQGGGPHRGFLSGSDIVYPLEYALAHTEQQVDNDLDVILRTIAQRHDHVGTKDLHDRLARADQVAYLALLPAIEVGLITSTSVLTYFQKSATVRVIPYAPVALVGIPFTAGPGEQRNDPRDYLMIPHEVGHQVYLRLAKPDQTKQADLKTLMLRRNVGDYIQQEFIQKRFSQPATAAQAEQPAWLRSWTEEIFADVYGCLIGGPASARTLQDLLKGVPVDVFVADDGAHPSPIVRPYIHIRVLEALAEAVGTDSHLGGQLTNQSTTLRQEWEEWLTARAIPRWLRPIAANGAIALPDAEKLVVKVVDGILASELRDLVKNAAAPTSKILWGMSRTSSVTGDLGALFDALPLADAPDLVTRGNGRFGWNDGTPDDFSPLETTFGFEEFRDMALTTGKVENPPDRSPWWLAVLEAGGWTEGPTGAGGGFKPYR